MNEKSIWKNNIKMPQFSRLEENISTDVLVIGGGIAGILIACELKSRGVDCVVVEKNRICSGVTGNTTAKITAQHSLIYQEIVKNRDEASARYYYEINQKAISQYKALSEMIKCDFEYKDNYVYTLNNMKKLEREIEALDKAGIPYEFSDADELPMYTAGAIKFSKQAQFNPLMLFSQLCKNLKIYENTFVRKIDGNTAITDRARIKANKIVIATHFPFMNRHGSYPLKLYQDRSYVIALKGADKINAMYIDESGTGLSFRSYGDYLLLGGGAHRTGVEGGGWNELRHFAGVNYPESTEEYHWAAQDCMSLDKIAYIGKYSRLTPDLYVATGFNKWGMTTSMAAAELISDLICNNESEYEELFSPSRSIIKPQLFVNSVETIRNMFSITPKRCTHLGCALKWNEQEHSWDCACHGSRYDDDGKILNNPAQKDLTM